jgi:hypothetical protein
MAAALHHIVAELDILSGTWKAHVECVIGDAESRSLQWVLR